MLKIDHCVVCGKPKAPEKGTTTGYVVLENLKETIHILPFDSMDCANKYVEEYAHPMFQTQAAFNNWKLRHPRAAKRILEGKKPLIFIEKHVEQVQVETEDSECVRKLRDDFKRIFIEKYGEDAYNQEVERVRQRKRLVSE